MNESTGKVFFYLLKELVAQKHLLKNPSCNKSIHDWTGDDIRNFQDDLAEELNERLSERWFYTHLKPKTNKKLPRIDMLNILSRYVNFISWDDFILKNKDRVELEIQHKNEEHKNEEVVIKKNKGLFNIRKIVVVVLVITCIILIIQWVESSKKAHFCFYNKDLSKPITDEKVEIILLQENQSPTKKYSDENGCIEIISNEDFVKFIVIAQYYKADTIERFFDKNDINEIIELKRDDYSLMIKYFATSDVSDWNKRRKQLESMFADEAVIFQVTETNTGMEMFNKNDFIDKLTTPIQSLGKIDIIETVYKNDKIISMRFIQK